MRIGVPKEIKVHEYRVGLTPDSVREFTAHAHRVLVETQAGAGIGSADDDYRAAGAEIATTPAEIFAQAEMIVKVKEPQAVERRMLRPGQILFTYLHLAPDPEQTRDLVNSGAICIAYETVTDGHGGLPLLAPMSQVAGRLSIQAGAAALERAKGGRGILLGGVPGVAPAKVVVIGGGVVGENAIYMALGMAADVTVLDRNVGVLARLARRFGAALKTVYSTKASLEDYVLQADLVVGGVLVAGAEAPKLVTRDMVRRMKTGVRCWWMSPSTRAAASKPRIRPRTPSRPMWWMAWCITASPTCRGRCPTRPLMHSTTSPCLTPWRWPTRGTRRRCWRMPISWKGSTSARARSPIRRWPTTSATSTSNPARRSLAERRRLGAFTDIPASTPVADRGNRG